MKKAVISFIIDFVGVIAAGLVFAALLSLFLVAVREAGYRQREYTAGVYGASAGSFLEASSVEGEKRIQIYVEGEGPAPEWYRPDEPMAAEWREDPSEPEEVAEQVVPQPEDVDYILDVPLTVDFQIYLHGLCEEAGVPYTLAVAVIEQESNYDPSAISPTNDWGLMQINAICHEWLEAELGIDEWLDPYQNAKAGVYILGMYYRMYGADSGTLVAYNQGQAAAEALFARGIYCTGYSDSVMTIRQRLEMYGR